MIKTMKKTAEPHYHYMLILNSVLIALASITAILLIIIFKVIVKSRKLALQTFQHREKRRNEIKSAVILTTMFGTMLVWLTPVFYCSVGQQTTQTSIGVHLGRFLISIINPVLFIQNRFFKELG